MTASGITLTGTDAANYTVNSSTTTTADIAKLSSVTWTGSGGNLDWFNPANWTNGAIPDLSNVANVIIPTGVKVSFDTSTIIAPTQVGTVNLTSITGGDLGMNLGTLSVSSSVALSALDVTGGTINGAANINVATLNQSGGSIANTGNLDVTNSLTQTGGAVAVGGNVAITQAAGDLSFTNISGANVGLTSTVGAVNLGNVAATGNLNVTAATNIAQATGTALTVTGTSTLVATNGDVTLANTANDFIGQVNVTGNNVTIADANAIVLGNIVDAGTLNVTAGTNITQSAAPDSIAVTGTSTLVATAGNITLTSAVNTFSGNVVASATNILVGTNSGAGTLTVTPPAVTPPVVTPPVVISPVITAQESAIAQAISSVVANSFKTQFAVTGNEVKIDLADIQVAMPVAASSAKGVVINRTELFITPPQVGSLKLIGDGVKLPEQLQGEFTIAVNDLAEIIK